MKKDKSYSEMMKACAMAGNQLKKSFVADIYIEMLLLEIQLNKEKEILINAINEALDVKDEQMFMELTSRYNQLMKRYGS
ncbi:IDEAL domain-containing protein [Falsibacillus pallidus]|uniref:IDEAL domain-containing protein n=1 Tax=Falsibacillus pallidus TaxID=493781 RepID=UPI003D95E9A5